MTQKERLPALPRGAATNRQVTVQVNQGESTAKPRQTLPFEVCPCPEASLLREWLCDPWAPPSREAWPAACLMAEQIHMSWIRDVSRSFSKGVANRDTHWARVSKSPSYAELERRRNTYANPPRSAAEIRELAEHGWDDFLAGVA